ncbi:ribonuclease H-like protein, partial [Exidia glandulosa HHB12029]
GRPYRLYTDASDEALGACLQQVQDMRVEDLKGTPAYERLKFAYATGEPVPALVTRISSKIDDVSPARSWGPTLDDTVIETERVVAYWSRTFKDAERNYSATEREALGAKEALIKFQPYIEGEQIIVLVTDHSALQWARTFENANRRLAALAELRERAAANAPAPRMAFADLAFSIDNLIEPAPQALEAAALADHPPPVLQVVMSDEMKAKFLKGYASDPAFAKKGKNSDERSWLCVPKNMQVPLMRHMHESAFETAHAGAAKLMLRLSDTFYWPRMRKDVDAFVRTCDVCQKTKEANFNKFGFLQPHAIPYQPYERISLDLVTGLPLAGPYNAILVVVDLLTKHAQFIPTDSGLDTAGFAKLLIQHVISRYGIPREIIADRDGRWLSHFFEELAKQLGTHLLLSSSHHPQHDGQTERTNRTLETSLRHYVAAKPDSWVEWLPSMEFAYNANRHSSTGYAPYFLLYGYHPRSPSDLLV